MLYSIVFILYSTVFSLYSAVFIFIKVRLPPAAHGICMQDWKPWPDAAQSCTPSGWAGIRHEGRSGTGQRYPALDSALPEAHLLNPGR